MDEHKKWLGIIPVNLKRITPYYNDDQDNDINPNSINQPKFDEARKSAAIEFLDLELNIFNMSVSQTKWVESKKGGGVLWFKVGSPNRQKIISTIAALSKKRYGEDKTMDIQVIPKMPNQFWERNKLLEPNCWHEKG